MSHLLIMKFYKDALVQPFWSIIHVIIDRTNCYIWQKEKKEKEAEDKNWFTSRGIKLEIRSYFFYVYI